MINTLFPAIKGLILDMDGVLWKDTQSIGDLPAIFTRMQAKGLKVILATNNSVRSVEQHQEKLLGFGVAVEPWQVVNSGMAVAYLLKQRFPSGGPVFIVGEEGLHIALSREGFYHSPQNALAVVGGYDRKADFEKLSTATLLIRSGLPFIGTNPDRTFPTPRGLVPGAGAFLAFLQAATDVEPFIAGKPNPTMYELAIQRLGCLPQETLAVGDRLDTDILGGANASCRTALVLSGVTTLAQAQAYTPSPDLISPDLTALIG